ncbi:MAG: hypothetical protein ACPG5B_02055 [Chitinophagales bacterium]
MIEAKQIPLISTYLNRLDDTLKEKSRIEQASDRGKYPKYLAVSEAIDTYFIYHKLRACCSELSFRLFNNPQKLKHHLSDFKFIAIIKYEIAAYLDEEKNPDIVAYWNLFALLEESYKQTLTKKNEAKYVSEAAYHSYFEWLQKHRTKMILDDVQGILSILTNLVANSNLPKKYWFLLNNELINTLGKKEKLPKGVYKNIILLAYKVKDETIFQNMETNGLTKFTNRYEWAKKFCRAYEKRLLEDDRTYIPFCKSYIEYQKNNLKQAYQYLEGLDYSREMFIKLNIKVLHIQIMIDAILGGVHLRIDKQMSDKLTKVLGSLYKQINAEQSDLSTKHFLYYKNMYDFLQNIWKLYPKRVTMTLKELQQKRLSLKIEIKKCRLIHEQADWLLAKVEQIQR